MARQIYFLIIFYIFILLRILQFLYNYRNYQGELVQLIVPTAIIQNNCSASFKYYYLYIKDCKRYQKYSTISVIGREYVLNDSSFFSKKSLNIQEIDENYKKINLLQVWFFEIYKYFSYKKGLLLNKYMGYLSNEQFGVLAGMVLGEKSGLTKNLQQLFAETGLQHVVVASGFNISLVVIFVKRIFNFFHRFILTILLLAAIIGYGMLTNFSPPILRALTMSVFSLVAKNLFFRQSAVWYSLLICCGAVVLVWPWLAFDISFQLSVMATIGVLVFSSQFIPSNSQLLSKLELAEFTSLTFFIASIHSWLRKISSVLYESFILAVGAQLFTLPLILFYFHSFRPLSLLPNTFLLWLTPLITILGFIFTISLFFPIFLLNKVLSIVLVFVINLFLIGISFFSSYSSFVLFIPVSFSIISIVALLFITMIKSIRIKKRYEI